VDTKQAPLELLKRLEADKKGFARRLALAIALDPRPGSRLCDRATSGINERVGGPKRR